MSLSRRQFAGGVLALSAGAILPAPVVQALVAWECGDEYAKVRAKWIREIAGLHREFLRCERHLGIDDDSQRVWWLAHHYLASQADIMRLDLRDQPAARRLVQPWLNTLYPPAGARAWRVPPPLHGLSPAFAELQRELDGVTMELGRAAYRFDKFARVTRKALSDPQYWTLERAVAKLLRRQHAVAGEFVHPRIGDPDDRIAMRRAADVSHGCDSVCSINARRRYGLGRNVHCS